MPDNVNSANHNVYSVTQSSMHAFGKVYYYKVTETEAWKWLLTKKQEILSKRHRISWNARKLHKFWPYKWEFLLSPENSHVWWPSVWRQSPLRDGLQVPWLCDWRTVTAELCRPGSTESILTTGRYVWLGFLNLGACEWITCCEGGGVLVSRFSSKTEAWELIFLMKIMAKFQLVELKIAIFSEKKKKLILEAKCYIFLVDEGLRMDSCLNWGSCEWQARCENGVLRAAHPHTPL